MIFLRSTKFLRNLCSRKTLNLSLTRGFSDDPMVSKKRHLEFELCQYVQKEIKEDVFNVERENFIRSFLENTGWKMKTSESSTRITLTKVVEDCFLTVYYDAKFPSSALDDDVNEKLEEDEEEDQQEPETFEFFLLIEKEKEVQLLLNLHAVEGEVLFNGLVLSSDAKGLMEKRAINSANIYSGPSFDSLDEAMLDKVQAWIKTLGINEEFSNFIEESSIQHESKLYRSFLEKFAGFLN